MPTYVYECSSCTNKFEAEQRISENPLTSCACGAEGTVKRIIQPIAVMFKGGGFHINDYAAKGEAKAEAPAETPAVVPATPPATPAASTPSEPSSS